MKKTISSIFSWFFVALGALMTLMAFTSSDIFPGILFLLFTIGVMPIKAIRNLWNKIPKIKNWMKPVALTLAFIIAFISVTTSSSSSEKFDWDDMILGEMLPEPSNDMGNVWDNSQQRLSIEIEDYSSEEYLEYVEDCEEKGFTIDIYDEEWSWQAYNGDSYKLNLTYSEYSESISIELNTPIENSTIVWPTVGAGSLLPPTQSLTGKVVTETSEQYKVYVTNTTIDDFKIYIENCKTAGFTEDFNKTERNYTASNKDGFEFVITYEGNNTVLISITDPSYYGSDDDATPETTTEETTADQTTTEAVATGTSGSAEDQTPQNPTPVNSSSIAKYSGSPYTTVSNGQPNFTDEQKKITKSFENYSSLDSYGRVGVALACLSTDTMPSNGEERGSISSIKPTGWVQAKYDCVSGKYLYNRCHLIGWQLSAENANRQNLITGTKSFNVEGMLPFENMVADYIHETNNHVMYRVTPVFSGANLLCDGVQIEAWSVEDEGDGICFNVFIYNVQDGVIIDYTDGSSSLKASSAIVEKNETTTKKVTTTESQNNNSNSSTMVWIPQSGAKYHSYSSCSGMKNPTEVTLEKAESLGYEPCKRCY